MAIADSLGHNFEFEVVQDDVITESSPHLEYPSVGFPGGCVRNSPFPGDKVGQFMLEQGQWTDDASMGLCLADSLLTQNGYNGSNIRIWFWNWWNNGLNNAFRKDVVNRSALFSYSMSLSVGLGGNIAKSIHSSDMKPGSLPSPRFESSGEDAGNGSLMRLAPIPLFFHTNIEEARAMAFESSLTTHPGHMAAEACALMAHIIVRALTREPSNTSSSAFLDTVSAEYEALLQAGPRPITPARDAILRLLRSAESDSSTERCWNWKARRLEVRRTLRNRGPVYNGYSVSPGYFGAFSLDGLALAMHCFYSTGSFNEAVVKVINFCGDSDTTGSICAQMAGAFYGAESIDHEWIRRLNLWDDREFELRAILLGTARREGSSN
eukprot:gene29736-38877_t